MGGPGKQGGEEREVGLGSRTVSMWLSTYCVPRVGKERRSFLHLGGGGHEDTKIQREPKFLPLTAEGRLRRQETASWVWAPRATV